VARRAEEERKALERKMKEMEEKKQRQLRELKEKEEAERKKEEEEIAEMEKKRKEELYESMKKIKEENRRREEKEREDMEKSWLEREQKAKEAERQRTNSFNQARHEMYRIAKIAKEKTVGAAKSAAVRLSGDDKEIQGKNESSKSSDRSQSPVSRKSFSRKINTLKDSLVKSKQTAPQRPPLPKNIVISDPVPIKPIGANHKAVPVKRQISKPSRPPPLINSKPKDDAANSSKAERPPRPPRPKSREEVAQWWREVEYERGSGLNENGEFSEWFHGIISRDETEKLLKGKEKGSFLVRVSERVWGYTVSYKDDSKCKHFLVDTSGDTYQFFGTQQLPHSSLNGLIEFHSERPISGVGQEILKIPCGQARDPPDYQDLLIESTSM